LVVSGKNISPAHVAELSLARSRFSFGPVLARFHFGQISAQFLFGQISTQFLFGLGLVYPKKIQKNHFKIYDFLV
jgi:hypothetical protein